jgi:hypothetical protein
MFYLHIMKKWARPRVLYYWQSYSGRKKSYNPTLLIKKLNKIAINTFINHRIDDIISDFRV